MRIGNFSEESLLGFYKVIGEELDFARCERPNGTFYGTSGTCRKGSPAGDKEKPPAKTRKKKGKSDEDKAVDQLGSMLPKGSKIQKEDGTTVSAKGASSSGGKKAPKNPTEYNKMLKKVLVADPKMKELRGKVKSADSNLKEAKESYAAARREMDKSMRKTKEAIAKAELDRAQDLYGKAADNVNQRAGVVRKALDKKIESVRKGDSPKSGRN